MIAVGLVLGGYADGVSVGRREESKRGVRQGRDRVLVWRKV